MNNLLQIFIYVVNQIDYLLEILFDNNEEKLLYRMIFIINKKNLTSIQFIFNKKQDQGLQTKFEYKICDNETINYDQLLHENELVIKYSIGNSDLYIIFDTEKRPYINLFLDYIIKAYFSTKENALIKILKGSQMFSYSFFSNEIFLCDLNCKLEKEIIISRAVTEFFYCSYNIDVNLFTILSSKTYEGISTNCDIIIPRRGGGRGKRSRSVSIKFSKPIFFDVNEMRRIRKIMELAKPPLKALLSHNKYIIGYTESDVEKSESIVSIIGKMNWKLSLRQADLIFNDGVYRLSYTNFSKTEDLRVHIAEITERQNKKINKIIEIVKNQIHGTTLIFGVKKYVQQEAYRLTKYERGMSILSVDLDRKDNIVLNLSSIDGAMLLDYDCNCYAIGVILDGDAVINGRTERGARYNSAANYIERQKQNGIYFFSVIISEDKTIDYIFST